MPRFSRIFHLLTLALLTGPGLTACNRPWTDMNSEAPEKPNVYTHDEVVAMYRLNTAPKRRYDITMTIENAPGRFDSIKGRAQYDAPDCMYLMARFDGIHGKVYHTLEVEFRQTGESTFVGTVYLDAMLDEDYFGKGVCRWQFTSATVELMATGIEEETRFSPSISIDEIDKARESTLFFANIAYPSQGKNKGFPDFGEQDLNKYRPELQDQTFKITLTPKEVLP